MKAPKRWTASWGAAATARSVHAALGVSDAVVRVAITDGSGNLRVVASHGNGAPPRRARRAERREAFTTAREVSVALSDHDDRRVSLLPMLAENEVVGVVEVDAPSERVEERRDAILALVRQSAELVQLTRERAKSELALRRVRGVSTLARDLVGASSSKRAMDAAADAAWRHLRLPVVVAHRTATAGWTLGSARGVGTAKRDGLRRSIEGIGPRGDDEPAASLIHAVGSVLDRSVDAFVVDPVALLTPTRSEASGAYLRTVTSLLGQAVRGERDQSVADDGIGLAFAAHELKGPLVGARAALDHVLANRPSDDQHALLRRTRLELEHLTQLVGPLLEWASGRADLRFADNDLVDVVEEAVASCTLGRTDARVRVEAGGSLPVRTDAAHLRTAIANLIRNALSYSPSDDPVTVSVGVDGDAAVVSVRDRGPGVRAEELDALLHPFARGNVGRSTTTGNGLGLYIARRVIEEHGGTLEIEPSDAGGSFAIRLPLGGGHHADLDDVGVDPSVLSA